MTEMTEMTEIDRNDKNDRNDKSSPSQTTTTTTYRLLGPRSDMLAVKKPLLSTHDSDFFPLMIRVKVYLDMGTRKKI